MLGRENSTSNRLPVNRLYYQLAAICGWISYVGLIGLVLGFVFFAPVPDWRTAVASFVIITFAYLALWVFRFKDKVVGSYISLVCIYIASGISYSSPSWAVYTLTLLVVISFIFWAIKAMLARGSLTESLLDLSILIAGAFFLVFAITLRLYNPNFNGLETFLKVLGSILIYFPAAKNVGFDNRKPLLWSIMFAFPVSIFVRALGFFL